MKKRIIFSLICFLLIFSSTQGQNLSSQRSSIIKNFVNSLMENSKSNDDIISSYIHLSPNDSSLNSRRTMMIKMIDSARTKIKADLSLNNFTVSAYDSFNGQKEIFTNATKDIGILLNRGKPLLYFYFNGNKIASFITVRKGNNSYFLTL